MEEEETGPSPTPGSSVITMSGCISHVMFTHHDRAYIKSSQIFAHIERRQYNNVCVEFTSHSKLNNSTTCTEGMCVLAFSVREVRNVYLCKWII